MVAESDGLIFTSWRSRSVGQLCLRRKARREAVGIGMGEVALRDGGADFLKKDVMGFWRNGWIPLMFQV